MRHSLPALTRNLPARSRAMGKAVNGPPMIRAAPCDR